MPCLTLISPYCLLKLCCLRPVILHLASPAKFSLLQAVVVISGGVNDTEELKAEYYCSQANKYREPHDQPMKLMSLGDGHLVMAKRALQC